MSMAGQLLVLISYPLAYFRRLWLPRGANAAVNPDNPPILLVHGLYHNASAWLFIKARLRAAGYDNVFAFSYSSWRTDYSTLLAQFDKHVRELERLYPKTPPVFIGHSLGGLIIRGWLKMNPHSPVRGVITFGTPHQGSKLARLGFGRLCHSLAFRGALIRKLEADEPSITVPAVALFSRMDNMVLPMEGLKPRAAGWTLRELTPVSHIFMLYSKVSFKELLEELDKISGRRTTRQ
ncbi:esterase/lipase family protein [Oleidesulfovibrio sp.]|uniref:esterase/lipase family protein n=1 Tax=Oleidesulfovibrio sp. TaxID=2909707 RepID=UPI003A835E5F